MICDYCAWKHSKDALWYCDEFRKENPGADQCPKFHGLELEFKEDRNKTKEICTCGRTKDIGLPCWWCGRGGS